MSTKDKKEHRPERSFWANIKLKVNIFLKRINRKEVLTFLAFLFISFFFWVIQSASEENDASFLVDLKIDNQPAEMVFTTQIPHQLKITIKDKNRNLLNYSYGNQLDSLVVDFNRYTDASGNFRISGAELQALLINKLFPSTQITSLTPSLIDARFAITKGKKLPVILRADFTASDNYRCMEPIITPDSVIVHAPNSILDTLTCIHTEFYEAHDLKDSLKVELQTDLEIGVKATPSTVKVSVPVARFVEKSFQGVKINAVDVPEGLNLTLFPNQTDITCLVDFSHYKDISPEDFFVSVSYNSIKSSTQKYIPVDVFNYSSGHFVSNVKLNVNQVEYIIDEE